MKNLLFVAALLFGSVERAGACFILFLSDGSHVLVGNHEDWFANDAGVKINPPVNGKYGSVIFTFMNEGWAQGGMNERGLFFDGAYTPFQNVTFDAHTKEFHGYIWQHILDRAATVDEAIAILKDFRIPELSELNVIIADAGGHVARVGVKDGKVVLNAEQTPYMLQTNFNPWNPELSEEPVCWRFEKATKHLAGNREASIDNMKQILEQTHQDSLTVYSNIYDLKSRTIYIFNKRDFKNSINIKLPEIFSNGDCMISLDSLASNPDAWSACRSLNSGSVVSGKVIDSETGQGVPFVNIGFFAKNRGTLSDPDGSFELSVPTTLIRDSIIFSAIGYKREKIPVASIKGRIATIKLKPESTVLNAVTIVGKKTRTARLGWMGGRDGVLPFDTIQGGGAVALLVESPGRAWYADKLQFRLMYNSKDTLKFRFHIYAYDSIRKAPGEELLSKEIILKDNKRFGWVRCDLSSYDIQVGEKKFFIGFEWIDDRLSREKMLKGLRAWERWKMEQYHNHNQKVEQIVTRESGSEVIHYKYHGNMMNWPGFKDLPPFTGLMVETGKKKETESLQTFERKTSFGEWKEIPSTLNAVITVKY